MFNKIRGDIMYNISEDLVFMLEIVGEEKFDLLIKHYSGTSVYFPMYKNHKRKERDQQILELYDGTNGKELARKFNISYQQIGNIIKKNIKNKWLTQKNIYVIIELN